MSSLPVQATAAVVLGDELARLGEPFAVRHAAPHGARPFHSDSSLLKYLTVSIVLAAYICHGRCVMVQAMECYERALAACAAPTAVTTATANVSENCESAQRIQGLNVDHINAALNAAKEVCRQNGNNAAHIAQCCERHVASRGDRYATAVPRC